MEKKSTTAQRLRQIMAERNLKQSDILELAVPYCKKYGVKLNKSDLSQFVNGKVVPGQWKLTILGLALGVNEAWLMGLDVSPERPDNNLISLPSNALPIPAYHMTPVVGEIACGTPILAEQNIEGYEPCPDFVHADFCLRCHGDSMVGAEIHDGDVVFIKSQPEEENGQIAAVEIDDGDCYNATLKRFYRSGDTVTLMAENPTVSPLVFSGDEINKIHIAGRAVYCLSKIK